MTKTENPEQYGMHVFERAGLGVAPFRCVGFHESTYQACPGAPVQTGSCCAYCGQGIRYCCDIRDSKGARFVVGMDCVERTGDAGIIGQYKTSPEFRQIQRDKAQAKSERDWTELCAMLENPHPALLSETRKTWDGKDEPVIEFMRRVVGLCGAAGRSKYLRMAKKIIAENIQPC